MANRSISVGQNIAIRIINKYELRKKILDPVLPHIESGYSVLIVLVKNYHSETNVVHLVHYESAVSGTGKTMTVEVIINELRFDLYQIDHSAVIDKYVGETQS